ncbi:hypothetical protein GCM10022235_78420 [Kribbella ginsengisoli]|uniref:Uncharacterized protein n=1 Tax=Kribbella ginsengisoli TaxID=363865 RepID=A0ABP6Z087_9ACTN
MEMATDRSRRQEQPRCDLFVRQSGGGEASDLKLLCCQGGRLCSRRCGDFAGRPEFSLRPLSPGFGAEHFERSQCFAQLGPFLTDRACSFDF